MTSDASANAIATSPERATGAWESGPTRPRYASLRALLRGRAPGQLIIQLTDRCNAMCPQCEMRASNKFDRSSLEMSDMKRMIDAAAEKGIAALSFTGGEPLLRLDDIITLLHHAGAAGIPHLRTGTNGFLFSRPEAAGFEDRVARIAERLAATRLRNFWISVDSGEAEVHEAMRGLPGVIKGIERALPIFHRAGIYPSANLGLNRNVGGEATSGLRQSDFPCEASYLEAFTERFTTAMERFYQTVRNLGFTMVSTCYPMSVEPGQGPGTLSAAYAATSPDAIVRFSAAEKSRLFKMLLELVPKVRAGIRVFSPQSSLYALHRQYSGAPGQPHACRGGIDFFFVNASDGNTYPCGYRGNESQGKFWDLDLAALPKSEACTACDWECFRDPSELLGPMLEGRTNPRATWRRLRADAAYRRYWWNDLRYYRACGFFDGRKPMDTRRLAIFGA